jgi:hypothetical protein
MDEIAKKRLKTLYSTYLAAVLLIFVITVLVELSKPPRFAAAILVLSFLLVIGGGAVLTRDLNASKAMQLSEPIEWDAWLRIPPPRVVRLRDETKVATVFLLTMIGMFLGLSILSAFLVVQLHAYPPKQLRVILLLGTIPCFAGALGLFALVAFTFMKSRRLVTNGEVKIGTVRGRMRNKVNYEFKDGAGRLVSASCVDSTKSSSGNVDSSIFQFRASRERSGCTLRFGLRSDSIDSCWLSMLAS